MSYIYHLKPRPFEGTALIPLNQMGKDSDLYKKHVAKYKGREDLMSEIIPKINCKWNDVVQFSALDPQVIVNELVKYHKDMKLLRVEYFKVHIKDILDNYEAVIFDRKNSKEKGDFGIDEDDTEYLREGNYCELSSVPKATTDYWERMKVKGGKFLWFPFIPHIMVKGVIETSNFELCELRI
jgi:hypothetical protein